MNTSTNSENKNLIAWVLLLTLAFVWGTSFLLVKKAVTVFSPIQVGGLRMVFGAIALLPWAISGYKKIEKTTFKYLAFCGLTGYLAPAFFFAIAGSKINSSLSGTLNSVTPIFVLIVGVLFFGTQAKREQVFGLTLGFIGSLILVFAKSKGDIGGINPYVFLVLASTILYGFNTNVAGKHLTNTPSTASGAFMLLFAGIVSSVVLIFTDFSTPLNNPEIKTALIEVIILGAINSGLMAILFNYLLKLKSPIFAASVTYIIPIIATAMGLVDGENISIFHYLGMAITLIGVYLINKK